MSDLIRRDDAILAALNYDGDGNGQDASMDIAGSIGDIPSVDAVEVVRCGQCEFRYYAPDGSGHCRKKLGDWFTDDGFCSDGKRREDGDA